MPSAGVTVSPQTINPSQFLVLVSSTVREYVSPTSTLVYDGECKVFTIIEVVHGCGGSFSMVLYSRDPLVRTRSILKQ